MYLDKQPDVTKQLTGQITNDRATHGGDASIRFYHFVLHLLDPSPVTNASIIELGSGLGTYSMVAQIIYPNIPTIAIENEPSRVKFTYDWIDNILQEFPGEPMPQVLPYSFTDRQWTELDSVRRRVLFMYINNAHGCIARSDIQQLNVILRECMEGSTIVSVDYLFPLDPHWLEEIYEVDGIERQDVAWWSHPFCIYKYTKLSVPSRSKRLLRTKSKRKIAFSYPYSGEDWSF